MKHLLLPLLLAIPLPAAAQSWCSADNLNATEATICADAWLSRLDRRMTSIYGTEGSGWAGKTLSQQQWLDKRNACGTDQSCIATAYRDRIATLTPPPDNRPVETGKLRPWCSGTLNTTERTICRSPRLADLDAAMSAVYAATDEKSAPNEQMAWLREDRDSCGSSTACITRSYVDRIATLGNELRSH